MPDPLNPLTPQDKDELKNSLNTLDTAEQAIKKAQRAGVPMDGYLDDARNNRKRVRALLDVYFPGQ